VLVVQIRSIKTAVAGVWVLAAAVIGVVAGVTSTGGLVVLGALGLLPPIALLLFWNEPTQTMSESINEGRR
jgi:hypothetical protein